jgi:hypothetical protein
VLAAGDTPLPLSNAALATLETTARLSNGHAGVRFVWGTNAGVCNNIIANTFLVDNPTVATTTLTYFVNAAKVKQMCPPQRVVLVSPSIFGCWQPQKCLETSGTCGEGPMRRDFWRDVAKGQ